MRKKTVRDLSDAQVRGKRALVRVDFNVPLDDDAAERREHTLKRRQLLEPLDVRLV